MSYTLIVAALVIAIVNWFAVWKTLKWVEYITKPAVMVVLMIWVWQVSELQGQMLWFFLGLLFSLVGDVLLMLPRVQLLAGLAAFLITHLCYIIGIIELPPQLNPVNFIIAALILFPAIMIMHQFSHGLKKLGKDKLIIPVLIYSFVISIMVSVALSTFFRSDWRFLPAFLVSCGALLFYVSDSIIGWDLFVNPLAYGKLFVRIPYHIGQILIILGAALHYVTSFPY